MRVCFGDRWKTGTSQALLAVLHHGAPQGADLPARVCSSEPVRVSLAFLQLLARFLAFARRLPIQYKVFQYRKRELPPDKIIVRMKRDLINFLFEQIETIQRYDAVKIYYADGQRPVSNILEDAFNYVLARNTAVFKSGNPEVYRLAQVADAICGLELVRTKYECDEQTVTDCLFFDSKRNFSQNFMKQLQGKRL